MSCFSILRIKLKYLDQDNQKRRNLAKFYFDNLSSLPITLPLISSNVESVYHLFVIQVEKRDTLINYLEKEGIIAVILYPIPIH